MTFALDHRLPPPANTPLDVAPWFDDVLPGLLAINGAAAGRAADRLGLPPLVLEVDGWRGGLVVRHGRLEIDVDDESALTLELSASEFADWVRHHRTARSLVISRDAVLRGGSLERLEEWELVLRQIVEASPVHEPGAIDFRDTAGEPLDLGRIFGPDDDPAEIAHFLREAGFLHLRGWIDPADMAIVADDIDRALPHYAPEDGRSWWATLEDGSQACVRLQHFIEHSPTTARILSSDRWDQLRRACAGDEELVQGPVEGTCVEALIKPVGVVAGVSDVPWHRDCAFGGHPYKCSGTVVGISVTDGTEESGLLRAVAGSHRASSLPEPTWQGNDLPVVALATVAGDVTVHTTCTSHEALPPTSRARKVMYTGFGLPPSPFDDEARTAKTMALRNGVHKIASQPRNAERVR
ncbi:MAG: phytanoyl-CoA dioxygenase family protein [Acidimicrobiales bacterium]